eukprot:2435-Pelagococcus_subviridis.AAC.5
MVETAHSLMPENGKKRDEDSEDGLELSPFWGIEKGAVLQEARCFNDSQLDTRRCQQTEATEVFFAVTKLFQSKDTNLRRMVYLIIKEICPTADEVGMTVFDLPSDMNSKIDLYRSNAIRALCNITDAGLLGQIERYLKQAVVDRNAVVASAALVSGTHLLKVNCEIVRRWSNEVQEAVNSKGPFVQSSKKAHHVAARIVVKDLFILFLKAACDTNQKLVITELTDVTIQELQPAVSVLQLFLSSSKPTLRFASIRALKKVALSQPSSVTCCNMDMEGLISDHNRSIATLAITTLLKTGNESSVERLLKQIATFMADIQDDFKIVVVEAIQSLCLKFPQKHRVLMNFLSSHLREEGGFDYKNSIIQSILCLIKEIPEAKDSGLSHLSEFIEDCEFTYLSSQILHLLGEEGPTASDPSKYIRYIYNRVILENATIRASAVCALAKFGLLCPVLLPRTLLLIRRCLYDNDDEVRDRATFFVAAMQDRTFGADGSTSSSFDISAVKCAPRENIADPDGVLDLEGNSHPNLDDGFDRELQDAERSVASIVQFSHFGPIFKSCIAVELTEAETEYKFKCTNTIKEQVLENVSVAMELLDGAGCFEECASIPLESMPLGKSGSTYVAFSRVEGKRFSAKFACTLKFTSKEVDPISDIPEECGYEDEYTIEDVELSLLDFMCMTPLSNFRKAWDALPIETETANEYSLGKRESLGEAVETVTKVLGLQPCEGTGAVPPNARSHTALLSGTYVGDVALLVRLNLGIDVSNEVALKLTARAEDASVSEVAQLIVSEA